MQADEYDSPLGDTSPDSAARTVLSGLDPEQAAAARAVHGPVCILAGAGTGKTRTITHRIAYAVRSGATPPSQLLAVTFTARAAGEMRGRLRELDVGGVQARTFHAAALRQLSYFAPRVLGGGMPQLVENKLRLVGHAAARSRVKADRSVLRDLAGEIEWSKSSLCRPEDYPGQVAARHRETPLAPAVVAEVYAGYEQAKSRAGSIDFEDLLLIMAAAIEGHRDVAEEVRARYRSFVVDEYQDVSPLQQRMLDAWLGGRDDLCVVGDAQQTIYSFAGAEPSFLLEFTRRFPGAAVHRLERDYRSTPQVVDVANKLVAAAPAGSTRLRLAGQRPPGPEPTYREFPDEPAEAAAVAARCRTLIAAGVPAAEIAVLFRINAQSEAYEQALATLGVPYLVRGGERFFARPEVREAMVLLRGGRRSADAERPLTDSVADILSGAGWSRTAPPPTGAARDRWESLAALFRLAEDLAVTDAGLTLDAFVTELEERARSQHAPTVQGVTLASLHAAKGLEWDVVFLVGLVDGTVPIQHARTPAEVEEERRLLYVGITRAREHLAMSWALARAENGRRIRRPSRFVDDLTGGRVGRTPKSAPRRRTAKIALDASDAALFEKLRVWRKTRAEVEDRAPYQVFSDATLIDMARVRPADHAGLLSVSGVGAYKLERYGADLLGILRDPDSP